MRLKYSSLSITFMVRIIMPTRKSVISKLYLYYNKHTCKPTSSKTGFKLQTVNTRIILLHGVFVWTNKELSYLLECIHKKKKYILNIGMKKIIQIFKWGWGISEMYVFNFLQFNGPDKIMRENRWHAQGGGLEVISPLFKLAWKYKNYKFIKFNFEFISISAKSFTENFGVSNKSWLSGILLDFNCYYRVGYVRKEILRFIRDDCVPWISCAPPNWRIPLCGYGTSVTLLIVTTDFMYHWIMARINNWSRGLRERERKQTVSKIMSRAKYGVGKNIVNSSATSWIPATFYITYIKYSSANTVNV